jgi:hypothetical protein
MRASVVPSLAARPSTTSSASSAGARALHGTRLYWLFYVAPARRYFELDAPTFEAVVRSVRIRGVAAPAPTTPAAPPSS